VTLADDTKVRRARGRRSVMKTLRNLGVSESALGDGPDQIRIIVKPPSVVGNIAPIAASILPVILLAGFFISG